MTSPPAATRADQPHLVSLVLQSKKALQHGEQLCSKANALTNASAQCAVDVLALDAKVKWISEAVIEQLKVRHATLFFLLVISFHTLSWLPAWQRASNTNVHNSTSRSAYVFVAHYLYDTLPRVLHSPEFYRNGTTLVRNVPQPSIPSSSPSAYNSFPLGFTKLRAILPFSAANIRSTR